MFDIISSVKVKDAGLRKMQKALDELSNMQALVGIPKDETIRTDDQEMTNSFLLYIHTHGDPRNRLPARPVIEPALEDAKDRIGTVMGEAIKGAMDGDRQRAVQNLKKAGMAGQNAARDWFTNPKNGWPPVSDERKEQKRSKVRKARKDKHNDRPLIDTGELRKSITYVVREKSGDDIARGRTTGGSA